MEQALYIYHFKNLHKIVCVIVQVLINKKKYREKKKSCDIWYNKWSPVRFVLQQTKYPAYLLIGGTFLWHAHFVCLISQNISFIMNKYTCIYHKKKKIGQQHYISKSIIRINFKLFSTSKFLNEILMEI